MRPAAEDREVDTIAGSCSRYKAAESEMAHDELVPYWAYLPMHKYIFTLTREIWPGASVNSQIPPLTIGQDDSGNDIKISAAAWLDQHRQVQQMTWAPGLPMIVENRLVSDGGWSEEPGYRTFNLYRPPLIAPGDASKVSRWLELVKKVYPEDHEHLVKWFAHRVQRPHEKINHAIVLGGDQGIGEDTILAPVKVAVGPWNFSEVSPAQLMGRFNGFIRSVILRVSEARDLGEVNRYTLYEHTKVYAAAPPDVLRCDEKNLREYSVFNVCGVIFTTNHRDGLYLPDDDRRHYVAWSELTVNHCSPVEWGTFHHWLSEEGGNEHVAAYLRELDLAGFDAKAPPQKTEAFWRMVDAGKGPEDEELATVLDAMGARDMQDPSGLV